MDEQQLRNLIDSNLPLKKTEKSTLRQPGLRETPNFYKIMAQNPLTNTDQLSLKGNQKIESNILLPTRNTLIFREKTD